MIKISLSNYIILIRLKRYKNINVIAYKLKPTLSKSTNCKFETTSKKNKNREEIIERWEIKVITIKHQKVRIEVSLSSKKKKNYKSDIEDEINPD